MLHCCLELGCDAQFVKLRDLTVHIRTHTGEKPFSCEYCDKSFATKSTLTTHIRTHTKEQPYQCQIPECAVKFTTSSGVKKHHIDFHSDIPFKPRFQCRTEGCSEAFSSEAQLVKHERSHLGPQPFECEWDGCEARFTTNYHRVEHVRFVHLRERPFPCSLCTERLQSQDALERHMRTHTGERPFACPEEHCPAAFALEGNMKTHWRDIHSAEGQQRQKKQEERVAKALTAAGINFKREHRVRFTCFGSTFANADFIVLINGGILIVEVDEEQHSSYSIECDVSRMAKMHMALLLDGNTLPVAFVRYNPHGYRIDGGLKRKPKMYREQKLIEIIREWRFGSAGSLQVLYMYYDVVTNENGVRLKIWADETYDETIRKCCLPPVV